MSTESGVRLLGTVTAFTMCSSHVVTVECLVTIVTRLIAQYVETLLEWTHAMKIILQGLRYSVARFSSLYDEVSAKNIWLS